MKLASFRHQSDSRYCFSLDESHVLIRLAVDKDETVDEITLVYGDPMTFAGKHYDLTMHKAHEDLGFDYYEAIVNEEPMRLMYLFSLKVGDKNYFLTESGFYEGFPFSTAFINSFQFVGENPNDFVLEPKSWKGRVVYQIFPERFAAGLPKESKGYVTYPWNTAPMAGKYDAFLGGDLQGVIDRLDYIKELGAGVIYLTPIHPSPTNHKYDVLDYFDVDAHFGGKECFAALVEKAHQKGLKIMMDLVFNHVSCKHPFFLDVCEKGRNSPYHPWFFIYGDKPRRTPLNYRCFGYHFYMPKLNTNYRPVQEYLIRVASYWAKDFGVDGFRLDVSEGVSHDFWMRLKMALRDISPDLILIGENWLNSESYLGPNQLDGVMNYPILDLITAYCLGQRDAKETALRLEGSLMRYKAGHNDMMLNLLSSHDVQRFATACGDKALSLLGYAILNFYPGHPMIYYGEEIFMEGGRDPDNRRGMIWDCPEFASKEHETFRQMLHLRQEQDFVEGRFEASAPNDMLLLRRIGHGCCYNLYCNLGESAYPLPTTPMLSSRVEGNILHQGGFAIIKTKE